MFLHLRHALATRFINEGHLCTCSPSHPPTLFLSYLEHIERIIFERKKTSREKSNSLFEMPFRDHWRDIETLRNDGIPIDTASNETAKLFDATLTQYVGW